MFKESASGLEFTYDSKEETATEEVKKEAVKTEETKEEAAKAEEIKAEKPKDPYSPENFVVKLSWIQAHLNAPKSRYNSFGKYSYRSAEDILDAVKPLLYKSKLALTVSDDILPVGDKIYIKATARLTDGINVIENVAYAREEFDKKGMDAAQMTGSASSYARKYALNGLFCIDDSKDPDTNEYHNATNFKTSNN